MTDLDRLKKLSGILTEGADLYSDYNPVNEAEPMDDPVVLIQGFGKMRLSQIERDLKRDLAKFTREAEAGNWTNIHTTMRHSFHAKLEAVMEARESMGDNYDDEEWDGTLR